MNIFENVKFGDKFLTRDGKVAIYQKSFETDMHSLMLEEDDGLVDYFSNGNVVYEFSENEERKEQDDDIVSRYQEPIDEEKLEELAEKYVINWYKTNNIPMEQFEIDKKISKEDFKAGYRRAMED